MNQTVSIPMQISVVGNSAKSIEIITKDFVNTLVKAQNNKITTAKAAKLAEENFKKLMVETFHKMFGIKTEDEIKSIDPAMLKELYMSGVDKDFEVEDGADFQILLSKEGRYPNWKNELIKLTSEAKAAEIIQSTTPQYSYKIQKG